MGEKMRIDKFISNMGFGSRKDIKEFIKKKKITVNGQIVKSGDLYIDTDDDIFCCGKKVEYEKYIYIMMNKPAGYVSANEDKKEKTVFELIGNEYRKKDLFVAGRLDKDTEGLLIITNNGKFAHNMLSPKKHVDKTYFVKAEGGMFNDDDINAFENGVVIDDGYKCKPAKISILKNGDISESLLTISEGKFHQVKRMFKAVGKNVIYLKRVKIGDLELDENIQLGHFKILSDEDVKLIGAEIE